MQEIFCGWKLVIYSFVPIHCKSIWISYTFIYNSRSFGFPWLDGNPVLKLQCSCCRKIVEEARTCTDCFVCMQPNQLTEDICKWIRPDTFTYTFVSKAFTTVDIQVSSLARVGRSCRYIESCKRVKSWQNTVYCESAGGLKTFTLFIRVQFDWFGIGAVLQEVWVGIIGLESNGTFTVCIPVL